MKYKAVIFDLFGTLIPSFSEKEYREKVMQIAAEIPAPAEAFWKLWSATFNQSILGIFPSYEAKITHICRELGVEINEWKTKEVSRRMSEYAANSMIPRPEAADVLNQLKSEGLKIGLITDCAADAPTAWRKTSIARFFDSTVFSCSVGIQKPDPRIYQIAMEQLKVDAKDCLYIGDGGSTELTGASRVGMQVAQLRAPGEDCPDAYVVDKEDWQGRRIRSLKEVLILTEKGVNLDYSTIRLVPAEETEHEFAYQVKKSAEGIYITQLWGWDEEIQRDFHTRQWQNNKPDIIEYDGKAIGTIAITENENYFEIAQFFIMPEYQNQGIGTFLLERILRKADHLKRKVRLRYLKNNPVATLYKRMGFQIVDSNDIFYSVERQP